MLLKKSILNILHMSSRGFLSSRGLTAGSIGFFKFWIPRSSRGMTKSRGMTCMIAFAFILTSCQGDKSPNPPVLPIQNMVNQTSFGPQAPNHFFADKRAARPPVPNTVAQGEARTDIRYNQGLSPGSTPEYPLWVETFPLKLDDKILSQGQKNFNIYCSPCHGLSGHNDGLVTKRSAGSIHPADIHDKAIISRPVGKIYDAVTNGVNNWNMPGFSAQLDTMERWGVVAYVRALQISEQGSKIDLPKKHSIQQRRN